MGNVDMLPDNQKIFIILTGCLLLVVVVELIRRRKMLEQYSAIWLFISLCAVGFIWIYPLLVRLTHLIGAGYTTSTILFCGLFAVILLTLQLSVKISEFAFHIKDMIQELTLLAHKVDQLSQRLESLERRRQSEPLLEPTGQGREEKKANSRKKRA
ncbi:MAG: DUF2304 domain-containing protein [bacterium]|jgi:hypothetical protein|nr:DUF2304 domain-containing protein [bacterium]